MVWFQECRRVIEVSVSPKDRTLTAVTPKALALKSKNSYHSITTQIM